MTQTESNFLQNTVPAAIATMKTSGVPASITLAQAIVESGWGNTALARKANNYFGIKALAHACPDDYIAFSTSEFVDGRQTTIMARFARYQSPQESFAAHAHLLSAAPRYAPAMAVRTDPAKFAAELQACGYSTNPDYATGLMKLVDQYNLTQYDLPPATEAAIAA